jgi:type I restriction enzyme S subunit
MASQVKKDLRLDAEYYRPNHLRLIRLLDESEPSTIGSFASVTDGIHGSPDVVEEDGIRYLSAKCVKDNYFSIDDTLLISRQQHANNRRTQMRVGDVLVTTVGTIGNAVVVTDDISPANADRHLGIIRVNTGSEWDPYYLATFLNSRLGRFQTMREATGNVQLNLFVEKIKTLRVVRIADHDRVVELTRRAYSRRKEAELLYTRVEAMLESALGLDKLDLTPKLFYERAYADARTAQRLDAEYYQPPKKAVLDSLAKMGGVLLSDQYRSVSELWKPDAAGDSEQVRNYDLSATFQPFLDETGEIQTRDTIASVKKRLHPGDLVVSRLRSYLREIAVVLDTGSVPMVGSTEFIVLRPGKGAIRVETLLVYLRSRYVQTVLKWSQDGSNHPRFDEKELLRLRIPDVVLAKQDEIADIVQASIATRREAHRLLSEAKMMVEVSILGHHCADVFIR